MNDIINKAKLWLSDAFDTDTRNKVQKLIDENSPELTESFYKEMEFGTGGMRGVMGVGINRMNKYTLGRATQGLCNYMNQVFNEELRVAIAYDCRHNSKEFAKIVADVFTSNNIKVFLFEELRPTPELSFTVTELNCHAGIVLTASHNPPEYNGYKVYWQDGAQIVPPQDKNIISEVGKVDFSEIKFNGNDELITYVGKEMDEKFWDACIENGDFNVKGREDLKIVFTSLHGTSIKATPQVLDQVGYSQIYVVDEQSEPNGDFPTVKSPNPEEPEALKMALELAEEVNADIVIGSDPDADRIGIAVRDNNGKMILLNGNQTMSVMINFLLKKWQEQGKLKGKEFVGSTIVTTPLISEISKSYGVETKISLTGFKWIAKLIRENPELNFIGGGEESFGFMVGDFLRDKDSVTSTLLACEIASEAKANGSSFYKELQKIYVKNGFYKEHLIAIVRKGIDGANEIKEMMRQFRENPLMEIDGEDVLFIYDYQSSIKKNIKTNEEFNIDVPKSNVLIYETENGTRVACRPSGTEPKIKFYISVNTSVKNINELEEEEKKLTNKINSIVKQLNI
ncbi:MAG: phospho-sugar mutase [Tenacibaculum sp.]|nr:phospho-sugar mutase [Tenacibaculum sp.]